MPRKYEIFYKEILIGHSDLEFGDPPMGVAFGKFDPVSEFENVRERISATESHTPSNVILTICDPKSVKRIASPASIFAFSGNVPDELEVNVLSIPYPMYEEWFPEHVSEYNNRFKA